MTVHERFNTMVRLLKAAWHDLELWTYNITYEARNGYRKRFLLTCPETNATGTDIDVHKEMSGVRKLCWHYWEILKNYFDDCTLRQQRYLIRLHDMSEQDT